MVKPRVERSGTRGMQSTMLLVVKNVEFCSSFFAIARQAESLKIIWKRSSKPRILKTGYDHDHAHVLVIVVVDGFVSQPSHWNEVRHE